MRRISGWIGAVALLVAGCSGSGGPAGDGETDSGEGTASEDGSSGGDSEETEGDPEACGGTPARVGLQRLTRAEYNRTVRDLFGVTSAPADSFPPDSSTGGFDNHAKSLTISPQLASLLLDAAETVAAEAMANDGDALIDCGPGDAGCVRDALAAVALRVYRRPATSAELDGLEAMFDFAAGEGETYADGMEYALQAMLMAPQFLYRSVPATATQGQDIVALDDYALATRLSYFLWGSTPDDALLQSAADGALTDPDGLRVEFDRMLADGKAAALYDGFFSQWLQLGKLGAATPDPDAFPQWSDALRDEMLEETRLFFADIIERDASPVEIVAGTQTFANGPLAEIYGVGGVNGDALEPVSTDPAQRAGVLTMPAVLAMTSGPQQPNIVQRGVWLAEAILCAEPPPPPEGVPPADDPLPGETERERLERHRSDPNCASCHQLIDPLGFALENYDALGAWRSTAQGEAVDNVGRLPDGTEFSGAIELSALLSLGAYYPQCVTEKVMTYALGRSVVDEDECAIEEISVATVTEDSTMSDLLWAVVSSPAFQSEQGNGG